MVRTLLSVACLNLLLSLDASAATGNNTAKAGMGSYDSDHSVQLSPPASRLVIFGDSLSDTNNINRLLKVMKGELQPDVVFKPLNTEIERNPVAKLLGYLGFKITHIEKVEYWVAEKLFKLLNDYYTIPVFPDEFYYKGRFCNGPTWSEWLGSMLLSDVSDPDRYINRAYGGSWASDVTDDIPVNWMHPGETIKTMIQGKLIPPNMKRLVSAFLDEYPMAKQPEELRGNQVFAIMYAANDYMFDYYDYKTVVGRIFEQIDRLAKYAASGASKDNPSWILVSNIPDVTLAPRFKSGAEKGKLPKLIATIKSHNALTVEKLASFQQFYAPQHIGFKLIDADKIISENIKSGTYAFEDKACYPDDFIKMKYEGEPATQPPVAPVKPCPKEDWDKYAFWDLVHPSRKAQANLGYQICLELEKSVQVSCRLPGYDHPELYPNSALNP